MAGTDYLGLDSRRRVVRIERPIDRREAERACVGRKSTLGDGRVEPAEMLADQRLWKHSPREPGEQAVHGSRCSAGVPP